MEMEKRQIFHVVAPFLFHSLTLSFGTTKSGTIAATTTTTTTTIEWQRQRK